jgi:hypothetical protein
MAWPTRSGAADGISVASLSAMTRRWVRMVALYYHFSPLYLRQGRVRKTAGFIGDGDEQQGKPIL